MTSLRFEGPGSPRLDAWLLQACPQLSTALLYKYHRQNRIKLNGKRCPLNSRLSPGDRVQLYLPEGDACAGHGTSTPMLNVLYEDDALLAVINPPACPARRPMHTRQASAHRMIYHQP